jgi:hypothetical protein
MMVSSHLSQIIFGAGFYKCLQTGLIIDICNMIPVLIFNLPKQIEPLVFSYHGCH